MPVIDTITMNLDCWKLVNSPSKELTNGFVDFHLYLLNIFCQRDVDADDLVAHVLSSQGCWQQEIRFWKSLMTYLHLYFSRHYWIYFSLMSELFDLPLNLGA